jgi:hypothetical protein
MARTTRRTTVPDRVAALNTAAGLLASAALLNAAGDAEHVSVTVALTGISIQISNTGALDEAARTAIVAAHAGVLATTVTRRTTGGLCWIETRGTVGGHSVHVWTTADPVTTSAVA